MPTPGGSIGASTYRYFIFALVANVLQESSIESLEAANQKLLNYDKL
jgi:hypothetical protein